MPRRSVIFCSKKNFLKLIVFSMLVLNVSAWTLSKTFWKNSIKWYGLLILWVRWEAKDVNPYGYLKCEVLSNIYLFNILCRVSQTLAGCLSENILRRKLAVVYLIGIFKFFFWCFDSLNDYWKIYDYNRQSAQCPDLSDDLLFSDPSSKQPQVY